MTSDETKRDIWFDYENQAWVIDGRYQRCGHPEAMDCGCYGRAHAGEVAERARETAAV